MPNKYDQQHLKNVDKYSKQIDDLYATAIDEVAKLLALHDVDSLSDQKIRDAATKFFNGFNRNLGGTIRNGMKEEWGLANNKGDALVKQVVGNHPDKRYLQGNEDALQSFINRQRDGLKLSDRVWNLTKEFKDKLEEGLKSGIGSGTGAKLQANDLLQYLNQQQGTNPGTGVYKDPRANARRLTRTETNMAYHEADWERWQQMDFVIGYEVEVSNNGHHCPLCLQLQGKYPKWFKFRSWHPQCYSDDTEVYTNHGWKLFADVTMNDQILSLNPDTKNVEWAGIVEQVKYFHVGDMIRFHNRSLDMLVTPDHPMKYIDYAGEWQEDPAIIATNKQLTISTDGVLHNTIAGVPVHAVQIHYHGNVYDLELDRNHLMYVRRNGKFVWGSNCMCHATAILAADIDNPESDPNVVNQVPAGFAKWVKDNEERSKGKPQPYFVRDNFKGGKLTGGLLKPESMPAGAKTKTVNLNEVVELMKTAKVEHLKVELLPKALSEKEIIDRISGGDMTKGSCSSLAFAYAGNKLGYDVLDFRDGISRKMFASTGNILKIADKVGGTVAKNTNDFAKAKELLATTQTGKEYYFICGQHAAIVRKAETGYEYLELQSEIENGFKPLTSDRLRGRFGAKKSHTLYRQKYETTDCIIDIDLLKDDESFQELLGYLNTSASKQRKGATGTVK